jgi:hypothetical protein
MRTRQTLTLASALMGAAMLAGCGDSGTTPTVTDAGNGPMDTGTAMDTGPRGHGPRGHGPRGHGPRGYGPRGHGPRRVYGGRDPLRRRLCQHADRRHPLRHLRNPLSDL